MNRRTFIKSSAVTALSAGLPLPGKKEVTHLLTLSFDDGFKKSFYKIAGIYEAYGLSACFNVIASGHLPEFQQVDQWIRPELMGNFDDWNRLQERGHEVMPHSWKHLNLARQPLEQAQELIEKCLAYFQDHLEGFEARHSVFNFPFNASTPELEQWALSRVLAIRSRGDSAVNRWPATPPFRQSCWSKGPENIDRWVEQMAHDFLQSEGGWLILNLHGLEDEGWGPVSTAFLVDFLGRMSQVAHLSMQPTGVVLKQIAGR